MALLTGPAGPKGREVEDWRRRRSNEKGDVGIPTIGSTFCSRAKDEMSWGLASLKVLALIT